MNKEELPSSPRLTFRPPDFLLPHGEGSTGRRSDKGPDIYMSWDGTVYGPTSAEDVLAGIRAASFKQDARFWFEGQEDWLPLSTFPDIIEFSQEFGAAPSTSPPPKPLPPPSKQPAVQRRKERHRRSRPHKPSRLGRRGRIVALGFVILAALLTVGLLSLLMFI